MAAITVTAGSVLPSTNAILEPGVAGATVTAGQPVYKEAATGQFKLSDANSATAEARSVYGVAINGASAGQPLTVQRGGDITIGATVVANGAYILGATPGDIAPIADLTSGWYLVVIGIAITAGKLRLCITESGVAS